MDVEKRQGERQSERQSERRTESGIEVKPVYKPGDSNGSGYAEKLADPGEYPYTRGVYPSMYRGHPWTMRQYAGFGTAKETNARFKYLTEQGQTGLSVAFDLPTQMGRDSDHPLALGEVGKVGVAIDSLLDMRELFEGIPLKDVSTSMTINSTASILLLFYSLVAEEQGAEAKDVTGTTQNDILKEYLARGTYIYPPRPSMRITTDMFAYCAKELPRWNTISISGYHIREAGSTAVQELAFTLSNAIAYVEAAVEAGLEVDQFAPRLSFFFNAHNDLFQEVAKYRAARRMWARIMRERFGAQSENSLKLRFHTQTAGSSLTAQQAENNIVRTTVQALSAILGGTQSLHTNAFDEALALPTEKSAGIALRTQQVLANEAGLTDTTDPLAGSYFIESLTDAVEEEAWRYIDRIDEMGGSVKAIEQRYMQAEIEEAAYRYQREIEKEERIIVGVNRYETDEDPEMDLHTVDETIRDRQTERLEELKESRDSSAAEKALADLKRAAEGSNNLLYPMKEALANLATLGEVSDTLREVFGQYRPSS
ncbi:MAG: Methylmalonyl-CoA mutase [uncultured Rubrobacteraceae bacterium]|uniref:Methylmalonyl-CoA mutase n=1 Tax=uncultured Rubrobacteraceae bacterium TaxID=349277 RepID=A0A6J4QB20_9ACTN|nr:MAG: Methylmalonyl-CoA mutase [uncultured Rubrobacteraceae bacterium]